ncbi:ABC-2 family transporter protein [Desulfosporosinus acididurans]|uniref:ABC-2 family transporter protein n=1 Tax=Desulfosporosinus acididurans TaxID=476652 RepID=A0A0J1FRI3_9FIRM|nr:ABC transporter permease subunit [Desulfosporosinus acididurans]KLU66085.1 ABC-2 family transporter protein [Desulfosporosinus acididurans]
MDSLKANVINEVRKLFLKKKTLAYLILMAMMSFLTALFISNIQAKLIFIAVNSISYPIMLLAIFTNSFLPLFVFMAASDLFPGEIADRTLKLVLTMPISRFKIYISKLIAISSYALLNFCVIFFVSLLSALCLNIKITSITNVALSYLADLVPALILVIFASFIVQFFRSGSTALISSIFIFIAVKTLSLFNTLVNNNLFTTYLNWSSLWLASGTNPFRELNLLLLLLAYGIIFFTAGYYLFDRNEV